MIGRVTEFIDRSEPCYGLVEENRITPFPDGSRKWRRIQAVLVNRGDELAEYRTDLGDAFLFEKVLEQRIVSMGDDSVAEVMEEAEKSRHDSFWPTVRAEIAATSTLIRDFIQEKEENWERINNRSVLGPYRTKQRNGFDKTHALRSRR